MIYGSPWWLPLFFAEVTEPLVSGLPFCCLAMSFGVLFRASWPSCSILFIEMCLCPLVLCCEISQQAGTVSSPVSLHRNCWPVRAWVMVFVVVGLCVVL